MASRQIYLSRNIFDVAVSGVADGEVLTWDNATEKWIPGTGGGGGHTIQDEGFSLTQRTKLNFVGAGVGVTDDSGNDASVVTISGGSGVTTFLQLTDTPDSYVTNSGKLVRINATE